MRKALLQDFIVPICRADILPHKARLTRLEGTAFFINDRGVFLTAGHVIRSIQATSNETHIGYGVNVKANDSAGTNAFVRLVEFEHAPSPFDVAIGKVDFISRSWFSVYSGAKIEGWKDVATLGYPQSALDPDPERFRIHLRSLKGHVQRAIGADELPAHRPHPDCFELNFAITNGLSGAPLFITRRDVQELIAICVYSVDSEVVIDSLTEIHDDGSRFEERRSRVEQYGIAHSLLPLMDWKPAILKGMSLRDAISPND